MPIFVGANEITQIGKLKVGGTDVQEVWVGAQKIWPTIVTLYDKPTMTPGDVSAWTSLIGSQAYSSSDGGTIALTGPDTTGSSSYLQINTVANEPHSWSVNARSITTGAEWAIGIGYAPNFISEFQSPSQLSPGPVTLNFTPTQSTIYLQLIMNASPADTDTVRWNQLLLTRG